MAGLELLSRHRVGGSVILVVQQPSAHQPIACVRVTSVENLEVEETAANHRDHRRVVMEVVDGPHDDAPNHANKYRDSGFPNVLVRHNRAMSS